MISEIHNCYPFPSLIFTTYMSMLILLVYVLNNCKGAYKLYLLIIMNHNYANINMCAFL